MPFARARNLEACKGGVLFIRIIVRLWPVAACHQSLLPAKCSHRRAFAPYTSPRKLGLLLQLSIDSAVIVPVLILCWDTEHGYGHLRGSIGVGG